MSSRAGIVGSPAGSSCIGCRAGITPGCDIRAAARCFAPHWTQPFSLPRLPLRTGSVTERPVTVTHSTVPALRRVPAGLAELAAYRELLAYMTITRLRVRYRQTWLGWAWAVLQPLALLIFWWVAGSAFGHRQTMTVAYPLFILAGLSPWAFLATSLSTSAAGMLASRTLIAKVYFPREIVPLSYVFA